MLHMPVLWGSCVCRRKLCWPLGFGWSEHTAVEGGKPAGSAEASIAAPTCMVKCPALEKWGLQRVVVFSHLLQGVRYVSHALQAPWGLWYVACRLGRLASCLLPQPLLSAFRLCSCAALQLLLFPTGEGCTTVIFPLPKSGCVSSRVSVPPSPHPSWRGLCLPFSSRSSVLCGPALMSGCRWHHWHCLYHWAIATVCGCVQTEMTPQCAVPSAYMVCNCWCPCVLSFSICSYVMNKTDISVVLYWQCCSDCLPG